MAYSKRIRGNDNEANEEFSHNRITVNMGSGGVIAVCFLCGLVLAAVGWMVLRMGTLFSILIVGAFVALFLGAGITGACFVIARISDAQTKVRVNKILSQTVIAGEIVAYRNGNNEWDHLSSIHEQAKVVPQITMKAESHTEPLPAEAYTVLDMHKQGIGFKAIAESTKWTEYAVRKLCNQADGKTS